MTQEQYSLLSNQTVTIAAGFYLLAFLAHLASWVIGRASVAQPARQEILVGAPKTAPASTEMSLTARDLERSAHRREKYSLYGYVLTVVATAIHLVSVVTRGLSADPIRVPWANMYEFTLTSTVVVTLLYVVLYRRYQLEWLSPVVTGFTLVILMANVMLLYEPAAPLQDALQSPWLIIHVVVAILATGAFTIGGMASVLYLLKDRHLRRHAVRQAAATPAEGSGEAPTPQEQAPVRGYIASLPRLAVLDRLAYQMHAFAFPLWTFSVLIAGPIWAQAAWGRYWNWDPKEVWAFITWVVYAAYLHARVTAGWKGRAAAIIALVGLLTLWFNFVGINFFFGAGSMHSYA